MQLTTLAMALITLKYCMAIAGDAVASVNAVARIVDNTAESPPCALGLTATILSDDELARYES